MLISSFLPFTSGQGSEQRHFNNQAEGQDSLRQTILFDCNNKSKERQVKETVPIWSQNWLPPCNKDIVLSAFQTLRGHNPGTSLVVQWLGLCAPNGGGQGSIPGQVVPRSHMPELRVSMPQLKILLAEIKIEDPPCCN